LRIDPRYYDITQVCPTEDDMRRYVAGLNQHRRSRTTPLTNEEKRARIETELKADPARSDRAIAEVVGVGHQMVATVRNRVDDSSTPATERKSKTGKVGEGQKQVRLLHPTWTKCARCQSHVPQTRLKCRVCGFKPKMKALETTTATQTNDQANNTASTTATTESVASAPRKITKIARARVDGLLHAGVGALLHTLEAAKPETIALAVQALVDRPEIRHDVEALRDRLNRLLEMSSRPHSAPSTPAQVPAQNEASAIGPLQWSGMVPCGGSASDDHINQSASVPGGTYLAMVVREGGDFSHYAVSFVGPDNKAKRIGSAKAWETAHQIAQTHTDKTA
jgi:hypothetical protein